MPPGPCQAIYQKSQSGYPLRWLFVDEIISEAGITNCNIDFVCYASHPCVSYDRSAFALDVIFYAGIYEAIALSLVGFWRLIIVSRHGSVPISPTSR